MDIKSYCPFINKGLIGDDPHGIYINDEVCYEIFKKANRPCIGYDGDLNSNIMIVGQSPSYVEDREGKPFVGPSGVKLNEILNEIGFDRNDFYITNAIKCFIPPNDNPSLKQISFCSRHILKREILFVRPKKIIALGKCAFYGIQYALFGKRQYKFSRGSIYHFNVLDDDFNRYEVEVLATYHPSYVLRHLHSESIVVADISKFLNPKNNRIKYTVIDSLENLQNFINSILSNNEIIIALDLETKHLEVNNNEIICIGIATSPSDAIIIPIKVYNPIIGKLLNFFVENIHDELISLLRTFLTDPKVKIIGHNLKFDRKILKELFNIDIIDNIYSDTMVLSHLVKENPPHDLKTLSVIYSRFDNYFDRVKSSMNLSKIIGSKGNKHLWYSSLSMEEIWEYCAYDCCASYDLFNIFEDKIIKISRQQNIVRERLNTILSKNLEQGKNYITPYYINFTLDELKSAVIEHYKILMLMEDNGLPFSKSYVERLKTILKEKIDKQVSKLNSLAGKSINWNSTQQIGKLFLEKGLPIIKKTKKGNPSYDEESLKKLSGMGYSIADEILKLRELVKANSTYASILDKFHDRLVSTEDDDIVRLSCNINITGTETGRLSTSNPSFHTIPRDNLYRNMIQARDGWYIVSADYSMAELRCIAGYSNCKSMLDGFKSGVDFHKLTAARIFHKDIDSVTSAERTIAKSVNFSIPYLTTSYGLAERLKISEEQAKEFIDEWFRDRPEVKRYIDKLISIYENTDVGSIAKFMNIFGRMRRVHRVDKFIPNPKNGKFKFNPEYSHKLREIVNFYPQSTVADTLAIGLIRFYKRLVKNDLLEYCKLLLTIHDAVLLEVKKEKIDIICSLLKESFEFPLKFACTQIILPLDISYDKVWKKD